MPFKQVARTRFYFGEDDDYYEIYSPESYYNCMRDMEAAVREAQAEIERLKREFPQFSGCKQEQDDTCWVWQTHGKNSFHGIGTDYTLVKIEDVTGCDIILDVDMPLVEDENGGWAKIVNDGKYLWMENDSDSIRVIDLSLLREYYEKTHKPMIDACGVSYSFNREVDYLVAELFDDMVYTESLGIHVLTKNLKYRYSDDLFVTIFEYCCANNLPAYACNSYWGRALKETINPIAKRYNYSPTPRETDLKTENGDVVMYVKKKERKKK